MAIPQLVRDVEHGFDEPQNQRDARVEELWVSLEPERTGELDLKGLKKGLRKIDHPMKNADEMLKRIMNEVDENHDGKIQYEEFRRFVEKAERQLFVLFRSIDKDGNGQLDKKELQTAFKHAGLTISNRRLTEFFDDIDINNDGFISFDEWRNFLLFMPPHDHDSQLHAVLSFYCSVVSVTPEGDSIVSEETLEGLGTDGFRSLFITLFGSLLRVAFPFDSPKGSDSTPVSSTENSFRAGLDEPANSTSTMDASVAFSFDTSEDSISEELAESLSQHIGVGTQEPISTGASKTEHKKYRLTDFIPDPGYFVAGAIAGGVSRTATAPLDRLKVYLLVNTSSSAYTAGSALRDGRPIAALKNAAKPFSDAVRDLFRNGGIRSFFAGNGLNVIKIMPETAIKFGSYEAAKRALANIEGHGDPKKISSYSKFTAGGTAGMIAQAFVYPLDTLKFRLQCETVKDGLKGAALVRQTAVKMYADGGVRACYRGLTMGLVGMFPYSAIDMGTFEALKTTYKSYYAKRTGKHEDDIEVGNFATGIIGATSGAFGASVVYPLNVVRTRLQTQGTAMHRATYTGIWDVTQKTIQREGYRGLYKGLTPNLLKVAPALSITWVVYENSKTALGLN
ncbi:mitochondrial carrier domain-containing protein [Thelonectria olida]|uniref:Mitochondrial thiamine pyrophosphate carrier 1 n=1 Tax=Thelonectria olida TaxID=1576542 RepID=A0A9P9AGY0_9HYPO|nr:mitochondrial carrier domain-containing protein [Thelonectria olida]